MFEKEVFRIRSKSQSFSMDIMVALGIFIIGVIVFLYLVIGNSSKDVSDRLATDSENLPQRLIAPDEYTTTNTTFVVENKVDTQRLNKTMTRPYNELKREMDITSDFCIHFEDENGNIVDLDEASNYMVYSMGNPKLNITVTDAWCTRVIHCGDREPVPPIC